MPVVGQPGSGLATDVPGLYDVVINGMGYMLLASLEPNLPFRSHRAIYSWSPTFVDRQNVSGNYGDNQQAFWLTASQNDFSLGSSQRYLRLNDTTAERKFWSSCGVDTFTLPGQVSLTAALASVSQPAELAAGCFGEPGGNFYFAGPTNLYSFNPSTETFTSVSAHGAGTPDQWGMTYDGNYDANQSVYISGANGIRRYDANLSAFSSFSSSIANPGSLTFMNNLLFSCDGATLRSYDTAGNAITVFQWKDARGNVLGTKYTPKIAPFGGTLLIWFPTLDGRPQLWQYDGTNTDVIAEFPKSAIGYDIEIVNGTVYLSGTIQDASALNLTNANQFAKSIIWYYNSGSFGELWRSPGFVQPNTAAPAPILPQNPTLGTYSGRLVFVDTNQQMLGAATLNQYDEGTGSITTLATFTNSTGTAGTSQIVSGPACVVLTFNTNAGSDTAQMFPNSVGTYQSVGYLNTSLIDFESSLQKEFRSARVDWEGNGTVDLAYSLNDLPFPGSHGSYTVLKTGALSGVDYPFPSGPLLGSAVALQVVLNQSSGSPSVKRTYVRAAPIQDVFRECTYILDLTGIGIEDPVKMNDDQPHMLSGYEQAQNLVTAIESQATFSVTDKLGTFVALADPPNCSIFEWREGNDSPDFPGCYVAQIAVKQVG